LVELAGIAQQVEQDLPRRIVPQHSRRLGRAEGGAGKSWVPADKALDRAFGEIVLPAFPSTSSKVDGKWISGGCLSPGQLPPKVRPGTPHEGGHPRLLMSPTGDARRREFGCGVAIAVGRL